jgi:hypothetical protein
VRLGRVDGDLKGVVEEPPQCAGIETAGTCGARGPVVNYYDPWDGQRRPREVAPWADPPPLEACHLSEDQWRDEPRIISFVKIDNGRAYAYEIVRESEDFGHFHSPVSVLRCEAAARSMRSRHSFAA